MGGRRPRSPPHEPPLLAVFDRTVLATSELCLNNKSVNVRFTLCHHSFIEFDNSTKTRIRYIRLSFKLEFDEDVIANNSGVTIDKNTALFRNR
jgi:hypothetical protein